MSRRHLRRPLAWGLAATILLPVVLALLLGLGRLLNALGDESGAFVCDRVALLAGVLWPLAVVATTIINAAINTTLLMDRDAEPSPGHWQRRRSGRRTWRRAASPWKQRRRRRDRRHGMDHDDDTEPGATE
jgi:hypothetical protein